MQRLLQFLVLISLVGCMTEPSVTSVPVERAIPANKTSSYYKVMAKDTLYSIAWAYGCDVGDLMRVNNLISTNNLVIGQNLLIPDYNNNLSLHGSVPVIDAVDTKPVVSYEDSRQIVKSKPITKKVKSIAKRENSTYKGKFISLKAWYWPRSKHYLAKDPLKGMWFKTKQVRALSDGVIVYNGTGIKGYGHLIIIKHANGYLSAYGQVTNVKVRQGAKVKAGKLIAQAKPVGLYLEVRKYGRVINLSKYLRR